MNIDREAKVIAFRLAEGGLGAANRFYAWLIKGETEAGLRERQRVLEPIVMNFGRRETSLETIARAERAMEWIEG